MLGDMKNVAAGEFGVILLSSVSVFPFEYTASLLKGAFGSSDFKDGQVVFVRRWIPFESVLVIGKTISGTPLFLFLPTPCTAFSGKSSSLERALLCELLP